MRRRLSGVARPVLLLRQQATMKKTPRVALFVETSRGYGREIVRGIWQYIQEHRRWSVLFRPHGLGEPAPTWATAWEGDGIIAHVTDRRSAALIRKSSIPCIDVLGDVRESGFPFIGPNNQQIAGLAATHLRDCGFRDFAVCGLRRGRRLKLDERCTAFENRITRDGYTCHVFQPRRGSRHSHSWEREQAEIIDWIEGLPKPIGLFACNDTRGREVLEACQTSGIAVPDDIAVVAAGNDELLCQLSDQQLSSVDVDPRRVGYRAAELLERLMAGRSIEAVTQIAPRRVVTRQSTDVLAIDDAEVAAAIQYIRRHACDSIDVSEVVAHVHLERRVLERRFRALLGRSPKAEIIRVRLAQAQQLLAETTLSSTEIACRCGFNSPAYFMDLFHRRVGMTPRTYRQANRTNNS